MISKIWNPDNLRVFQEHYPRMSNRALSSLLNITIPSIKRKARELGLKKIRPADDDRVLAIIRDNFHRCSLSELANLAGTSTTTMFRIVAGLGLHRDKEATREIKSRIRKTIIKREKLRLRHGINQITRIRLVCAY